MAARFVFAILLFWPAVAAGQVTGRFYLQKDSYAPGEPIFLYLEETNSGRKPQKLADADLYGRCSGIRIHVSTDLDAVPSCAREVICCDCLLGTIVLEPGKSRTQRILLNYEHAVADPGEYEVEAETNLPLPYSHRDPLGTKAGPVLRGRFHFRVDVKAAGDPEAIPGFVKKLGADDESVRWEAGLVLASLAPKPLEEVLLNFAGNPEFRQWAPLAFYRLNTPRSLEGLANLLRTAQPGSSEHMQSAEFLAKTGDPKWYPLLRDVAEKNAQIANYVVYAAESGGDQMVPVLVGMAGSPDHKAVSSNAIAALGYTGSRAAVPILISFLRNQNPTAAFAALTGLRQLTHRSIGGERWYVDPPSQYPKWLQWWNREGANAPIYKADAACVDLKPLD